MGLETGVSFITDLVAANPAAGDTRTEGDDHIRNIKTAVQGSFASFTGAAVTATEAELNYNDITTLGTAQASKALTANASGETSGAEFISPKVQTGINDTNGNELLLVTATASAVNELTLANAATGNNPTVSATGGDTNIGIAITAKGTGGIDLNPGADGVTIGTGNGIDGVLDEDNMATDSDTHLATQQSIKAYVDTATTTALTATYSNAAIGSTGATWTDGTPQAFTHSLGSYPDFVSVFIKCVVNDGTYEVDDVLNITNSETNANGGSGNGVAIQVTTTQIIVNIASTGLFVVQEDGTGFDNLTDSSWQMYVKAFRL